MDKLLNQLILIAGAWQLVGCKDEKLEKEFESLLNQVHPKREVALLALQAHIGKEVAA